MLNPGQASEVRGLVELVIGCCTNRRFPVFASSSPES